MQHVSIFLALFALAACGSEPVPSGATSGEAKALDDAAEMIEEQRLPDSALRAPPEQIAEPPAATGAHEQ